MCLALCVTWEYALNEPRGRYDLARENARPWLFGILTKEIARRHRTEKARFRALERAWSDRPADGLADQVAADVTAQATRGALAAALARLSPAERGVLIRQSYLRPAALAALFNAVTEIPGVSVADHAVNAVGQQGVAVQQVYRGISQQLIFNPRTYAFIGEREVAVNASSGLKAGTVLDSTAILGLAVADHAGQLP